MSHVNVGPGLLLTQPDWGPYVRIGSWCSVRFGARPRLAASRSAARCECPLNRAMGAAESGSNVPDGFADGRAAHGLGLEKEIDQGTGFGALNRSRRGGSVANRQTADGGLLR
jgi:hypothetical protein